MALRSAEYIPQKDRTPLRLEVLELERQENALQELPAPLQIMARRIYRVFPSLVRDGVRGFPSAKAKQARREPHTLYKTT